jgi:hypothetical protein
LAVNPLIHLLDRCPDDEVADLLGVLADALEEAGDVRAAGFRRIGDRRPAMLIQPFSHTSWRWLASETGVADAPDHVPQSVITALGSHGNASTHPSRSAAFLALAAVLAVD